MEILRIVLHLGYNRTKNWHWYHLILGVGVQGKGHGSFPPQEQFQNAPQTQCLKITEKVSFNIAREASYIYILEWTKVY